MAAGRTMARVVAKAAVRRTVEGAGRKVADGWASARMEVRAAKMAVAAWAVAKAVAGRAAAALAEMEAGPMVEGGLASARMGVRAAARAAVVERGSGTLPPSL